MTTTGQPDRRGFDPEGTDRPLLDLIRRRGPLTIAEMASELGVTATAVRNRLSRLCGAGLVGRRAEHGGRGRPKYVYEASPEAHRRLGQNYADLAVVLWGEVMRNVGDRKVRRVLFARITDRLADLYRAEVRGLGWQERLEQLGTLLHGRGIETEVARRGDAMPVLELHSCPYFELAESDRDICSLERKMFEKVLGRSLKLSQCRLDGHRSCDFEAKAARPPAADPTQAHAG
ncbi:helix-turn-helix transcriptional regulator [Tautonia plasticadhaerens]|uniref:MarR family protein n=1 Tax=Tautonia plasticadhaerens TaxID=2527974 RepID=A0A518HAG1_9BACT|nr:MarR family transcriptional regulator [Tautonia plasticadhaerens]QDV37838.1 MarR family protein [Tautonia plasticadhaerens]